MYLGPESVRSLFFGGFCSPLHETRTIKREIRMIKNVTLLLLIITPLRIRLSIRLCGFNYTIQLDCKKAYAQELNLPLHRGINIWSSATIWLEHMT